MLNHLRRHQRAGLGKLFLERVGRPDLWSADGPTALAVRHLDHRGRSLPYDERVVLLVAFEIWNESRRIAPSEVLNLTSVDGQTELLELIGSAIAAIGRGELHLEQWLRGTYREGVS